MAEPRRTFIVRVYGGDVVIEDVRSHRRARVSEVDAIGAQIGVWLAQAQMPAPTPATHLAARRPGREPGEGGE